MQIGEIKPNSVLKCFSKIKIDTRKIKNRTRHSLRKLKHNRRMKKDANLYESQENDLIKPKDPIILVDNFALTEPQKKFCNYQESLQSHQANLQIITI